MKNSDLIFKGGKHSVTSPFGMRMHPIENVMKMHNGVDYGTSGLNLPLYAIADGYVRVSTFDKTLGNYISIGIELDGQKYRTVYKHMQKLSHLKVGEKVKKGDLVGYVGKTGAVTGTHLHFDFIKDDNGKLTYLDFEKAVFNTPTSDKQVQEYIDTINTQTTLIEALKQEIEAFKRIESEQTKTIGDLNALIKQQTLEKEQLKDKLHLAELQVANMPRLIFTSPKTKLYQLTIKKGDVLYIKEN